MARLPERIAFIPPYDEMLSGLLSFKSFQDAERTLLRLQELREKYRAENDDRGVGYCRQIAMLGRRRAKLISRDRRVQPVKRQQKKEIAMWFQVWLETPDLFASWLDLRKSAASFKGMLSHGERDQEHGQES